MTDNYPSTIKLTNPEFPYFIEDTNTNPTSSIAIRPEDNMSNNIADYLFIIAGGAFVQENNHTGDVTIQLRHSFARDDENDRSYVANIRLANLVVKNMYASYISYTGWLTAAQFFPDGYEYGNKELPDNSFRDAVRKDDTEDHYANADYPYLPPTVIPEGDITFPLRVEVTLAYNLVDARAKLAEKKAEVIEEKAERVKRAEARRIEREKKAAEDRRRHEEWLATDEGQAYEVERVLFKQLKSDYPADAEYTDAELDAIAELGAKDAAEFPEEKLRFMAEAIRERSQGLTFPADQFGRHAYLAGFNEVILARTK